MSTQRPNAPQRPNNAPRTLNAPTPRPLIGKGGRVGLTYGKDA